MLTIPLQSLPNQQLDVILNQQRFTIRLITRDALTYCDIQVNGEYVVAGVKCTELPIIPYEYIARDIGGNFLFVNSNSIVEYPNYTKFNTVQNLIFFTIDELESAGYY